MGISRRKFLGTSAAAVIVAGTRAKGKVFGANDRIRVCVVGFNGQGGSHIDNIMEQPDAEVVALCDVDSRVLARGAAMMKRKQDKTPKTYVDVRDVMADADIDAISTATPNHWHSLITVWACQAGKDVYVEKPLSHSVWEGRQVAAAAEKYGRIVMHGTQSRSNPTLIRDIGLMHKGFIGEIVHSRGYVYKNGNRMAIGHGASADVPDYLNWPLWQGPAQEKPYLVNADASTPRGLLVHYNWHWVWEYGNGEIGNQGVHEMDIACWGHNRGLPVKISSTGGRYKWDDDGETPNTQATQFTYADGSMMTFEVRNLGSFQEADGGDCGNSFFGTEGYYVRGRGFFDYKNKPIQVDEPEPAGLPKFAHFFKAIRSRNPEDVTAPALAGHLSCVHCHIGNIAYRIGHTLDFDPATETFVNNDAANALIKRSYREGFEVPQVA